MRALFTKDIVILMFFLSSGLTVFSFLAFDVGFDRAFVVPRFRLPEELIAIWVGWSLLFGWALGATDQIRGLSDYVAHRGFSKARLFWTQQGLAAFVILMTLTLPWILLAIFGQGLYEPDYFGVGLPWILASSIALPCYAIGIFLSKLPLHIGVRLALTFPMAFWIVGGRPDRILEGVMHAAPMGYAFQTFTIALVLLVAGFLAMKSNRDQDLPVPGTATFPTILLLVAVGWPLHAFQSTIMATLTGDLDRIHVSKRPDGSFTLSKAEYDRVTGKITLWELDPDSHEPTVFNNGLNRVDLARRQRRRSAFSGASRSYQTAGTGLVGNVSRVSAYVSPKGKGILHLVERDLYNGTKLYLEKPSGPFSKQTRLFDPYRRNGRAVIWAGDPADGTAWFADFSQKDWKYVQLELPGQDRFESWLEPSPGVGFSIAKEISGQEPRDSAFRLAFIKTTGGIVYVDRDSKQVTRLTEEQMAQVSSLGDPATEPLLHVSHPGLLFRESEVRTPEGEVLFTYDFSPSTPIEYWKASLTAIASVMHPPLLAPKAFGNITHVQRGRMSQSMSDVDAARNPIRYASMQALSRARLTWTGFSPWSSIAWILLAGLAYLTRRSLIKQDATGARLWLWPLAVLAFGPLASLLQFAMEPKRAFYPLSKTEDDTAAVLISDPV